MGADILAERHRGTGWRRGAGFRHTHAPEWQHAKPSQAAGNKARTAQKGAAIQPTFRLTDAGDRGGPAATDLPFCSTYEHKRRYVPG